MPITGNRRTNKAADFAYVKNGNAESAEAPVFVAKKSSPPGELLGILFSLMLIVDYCSLASDILQDWRAMLAFCQATTVFWQQSVQVRFGAGRSGSVANSSAQKFAALSTGTGSAGVPQLLNGKSGRRGSNPRRPAWEIGRQLEIMNNRVSGADPDSSILPRTHGFTLLSLFTG
jgi:hypothetical protein